MVASTHNDTPAHVGTDYFIARDGSEYAGSHLLVEFWGSADLDDVDRIRGALREAAMAARATLLHLHVHHFGPECGVTGIAVLAESHISIHSWPERGYAAIDVFMCGSCDPYAALPALERAFSPATVGIEEHRRGLVQREAGHGLA